MFHTIAVPQRDILEGRMTMDVFAADLWDVFKNRGPDEYKDEVQFFQKTYMTEGLKSLLALVEKRLQEKGGDPVIQLQTSFGGGKTHALIAMYHKAREWRVRPVVLVGEKLKTGSTARDFDTLWGLMEEQLTGSKREFSSVVPPGGEQIKKLLEGHLPVLILMDELVSYLNTADAVRVENTTLITLTLTFLHNLTNVVSEIPGASFVLTTTPSNPYNRTPRGEEIVADLQNITARREIIKSPVQEQEITQVIRRRLFSRLEMEKAGEVIRDFMEYAVKESILPAGTEPSEYRKRFEASYPFLPEVIDVLYQRWGSFPNFQRTRGVLRLLSLVIHSLKESKIPYVGLADFDLGNQELRQELLKHTGQQFDSVIAADITSEGSGSRKVDEGLGDAYKGLRLGSRATTTVFLYSHSGGPEKGASLSEVKRSATTTVNPASVVAEALEELKGRLFYIQHQGGKYYFTNQPNLNRILLTKMENVLDNEVAELEKELLKKNVSGGRFKTFLRPGEPGEIPDNLDLKLIILKTQDNALMKQTLETKGATLRANRNTLFFLTPFIGEQAGFHNLLKRVIAYRLIGEDKTLNLSDEQKKEIRAELKKTEDGLNEALRRYYRSLFLPAREGFKELDLGIPTYGEFKKIDEEIYEKLRSEGDILERVIPLVIKERYLKSNDHVLTEQLYQTGFKTPGEIRVISREVWEKGIGEGVRQGLFGLGELADGRPVCRFFKQSAPVALAGSEVIIREDLCALLEEEKKDLTAPVYGSVTGGINAGIAETGAAEAALEVISKERTPGERAREKPASRREICLRFAIPKGKVASIMGVINLLQSKFDSLEIELLASNGEISEQDYEDKIREAFRQLGVAIGE
jgi:hypothetical protein